MYLWQARMGDNLAHGLGEEVGSCSGGVAVRQSWALPRKGLPPSAISMHRSARCCCASCRLQLERPA